MSTSSNQSSLSLTEDADGAAADEAEERREEPQLSMADDGRKTTDVRPSDKISPSPLSPPPIYPFLAVKSRSILDEMGVSSGRGGYIEVRASTNPNGLALLIAQIWKNLSINE